MLPGEKCILGLSDPFDESDSLFDSLNLINLIGDPNLSSPSSSTSSSCKCGKRESCFNELLTHQTSSRCDFEESKCMCGNKESCTGSNPWCIKDTCKCSIQNDYYENGDGSTKGTCSGENEKCMEDGTCKGLIK